MLGITSDGVKFGENSDCWNAASDLTPEQMKKLQVEIDHVYDIFLGNTQWVNVITF